MHRTPSRRQTVLAASSTRPVGIAIVVCLLIAANLAVGNACSQQDAGANCTEESQKNGVDKDDGSCYRAAVFEYIGGPLFSTETISLYGEVAEIAANNGAKVLVFPEGGLSPELSATQFSEIPDPEKLNADNNILCLRPRVEPLAAAILSQLSCIARANKLYLVANYGTSQKCQSSWFGAREKVGERHCPFWGRFRLNTNVVLDPEGRFIRQYRKYNLWPPEASWFRAFGFRDSIFRLFNFLDMFGYTHPPSLEEVYFDTPYGRFGVFTCFDMAFKWPAINLVEKHHIDTALFPTLWHDEAPIFSATLTQDGWSRGNKVNLLAANMLKPRQGAVGSGIYSGDNSAFTLANSTTSKLLIANLASKPRAQRCSQSFDPLVVEIDTKSQVVSDYEYRNYKLQTSDKIVSPLQAETEGVEFCSGRVCCSIDLKIKQPVSDETLSKLVIVVRDNNRDESGFNFYEQVCLLASLEKPLDRSNLDKTVFAREALVEFERLSMEATFESRHVMPMAGSSLTLPIDREDLQFECSERPDKDRLFRCKHVYSPKEAQTGQWIYSFAMYGRMYSRDKMPPAWIVASELDQTHPQQAHEEL